MVSFLCQLKGPLTITLSESSEALDEVVVTGLGSSIKRANLANAVSTVSAEELVGKTSQTTVDGALYGKVTGVNITSSSGAPGGGFALRLRGISSINGNNQPLFIVDGVYISSAAAIYGTRANAGVVIITTKRGKGGKTKISFSQDTGVNIIQRRLGLRPWTAESVFDTFFSPNDKDPEAEQSSRESAEKEVQAFRNALANGGLIDYEDEIYGSTGFITETKLNASGGSDKTKFYIGGSYRDEEGIIKNTGFERFSLRGNIDHKISNVFDVSLSSNYVRSGSSRSFTGNENEGGLSYGYTLAFTRPWNDLRPDADGNYPNNPNYSGNPLFVRDNALNEDSNNRFIQGVKLNTKLVNTDRNRLKLVLNGGVDYLANETYVYVPETHQAQVGGQEGFVAQGNNNFTQLNGLAIAVWDHSAFEGDLSLTSQAGLSYLDQKANLVNGRGTVLIGGQTSVEQSVNQAFAQTRSRQRDFGYFGQIEGNYKDQLIATVGYRLDKSTLNGDPNRFYGFPKASLALNIANFDFWKIDAINQFKLRSAYGETGSSAAYGSVFTLLNPSVIAGNGGLSVGAKGDAGIQPETSAEFEAGIDIGLFNNRISLEATYYNREVRDLILSRILPASSGFSTETTNLADMVNTGIELALRADIVDTDNFYWNTGIQFFKNVSEVTRLDVPAFAQPGAGFGTGLGTFFIEEGQPVTQLVGSIDPDGDGDLPAVLEQVGNVEPDFQMGFNNTLTIHKQWDLSFLVQWKNGGDNLNLSRFLTDIGQTSPDLETPEGQARAGSARNAQRFVEDAGYIRLREAALYYRIPTKFVRNWVGGAIEGMKLGFSGRNIFTITDYSSYDPEVSVNGGAGLSSGIEVTPFPPSLLGVETNASLKQLNELAIGVESTSRNGIAISTTASGTMARELYLFDADPRNTGDLLGKNGSQLDNNSFYSNAPFAGSYRCIKNINILLEALDNTKSVSEEIKSKFRGFANTFKAYEFIEVLKLYGSARIDVSDLENLGPFLDFEATMNEIRLLLDNAYMDLSSFGKLDQFDFPLGGFTDLIDKSMETPDEKRDDEDQITIPEFVKFNRAVAALAAVYDGDGSAALTALEKSYFGLTKDLGLGVKHVFSLSAGDQSNGVFKTASESAEKPNNGDQIIVHNSWIQDAEVGDARVSSKAAERPDPSTQDELNGTHETRLYASNVAPIDMIRNEELILLYAEASIISGALDDAEQAINVIRSSASLLAYTGAKTAEALTTEMLNQRRYSLWGENHRMFDLRRYDLSNTLPVDRTGDQVFNILPIPLSENVN